MRSLRGRLAKLEEAARPPAGRCPHCPPERITIVEVDQAGNVLSGAYPQPCKACGGPHDRGIQFIEIVCPSAPPQYEGEALSGGDFGVG